MIAVHIEIYEIQQKCRYWQLKTSIIEQNKRHTPKEHKKDHCIIIWSFSVYYYWHFCLLNYPFNLRLFIEKCNFNIFRSTKMSTSTTDSQNWKNDNYSELSGWRENIYSVSRNLSHSGTRRNWVQGWNMAADSTLCWSVVLTCYHLLPKEGKTPCALSKGAGCRASSISIPPHPATGNYSLAAQIQSLSLWNEQRQKL